MTNLPLPYAVDAEEAVLGAILLDRNTLSLVSEIVTAEDFYVPKHQTIYEAFLALDAQGAPLDVVTVHTYLIQQGHEHVSGADLVSLQAMTPATSNAPRYARIVHEYSQRRAIIRAGQEITDLGRDSKSSLSDAMQSAESILFGLTGKTEVESQFRSLSDGADEWWASAELRTEKPKISTGFSTLDSMLGGWGAGRLILLGARPAMGKTSMAVSFARHIARQGQPVLYVSLEGSHEEMQNRFISLEMYQPSSVISRSALTDKVRAAVEIAFEEFAEWPIDILDAANGATTATVRSMVRRALMKRGKSPVVIVDYLQLMSDSGRYKGQRHQEVAEISSDLRMLAREFKTPVIALAQLSRQLENRLDKRPVLADLRESGNLEQDGAQILFLYRDEVYDPYSPDRGFAELIVAKNRFGPIGSIKMKVDLPLGGWFETTQREESH